MADWVRQFTRDGTIGSGSQTVTWDFNTQAELGDPEANYSAEINVVVHFATGAGSLTFGGRWGGCFRRTGGNLATPFWNPDKLWPTSDASTLTWALIGTDTLRFSLDVFYPELVTKYWRTWMTIYAKDDEV